MKSFHCLLRSHLENQKCGRLGEARGGRGIIDHPREQIHSRERERERAHNELRSSHATWEGNKPCTVGIPWDTAYFLLAGNPHFTQSMIPLFKPFASTYGQTSLSRKCKFKIFQEERKFEIVSCGKWFVYWTFIKRFLCLFNRKHKSRNLLYHKDGSRNLHTWMTFKLCV